MTIYVFDMDGTLTPPRRKIEEDFAARFHTWQQTHKCFIASGSDENKIKEQLSDKLINEFDGIYSSMGNVLKVKSKLVYKKEFKPNSALTEKLESYRQNTAYPGMLYPNYIEQRTGMVNFSVLGRDCPFPEREKYAKWDKKHQERQKIKKALSAAFPQYEIAVGGAISIDITPKGCGKGQIARHLRQTFANEKIVFFGDKTFPGGNDYELAQELQKLGNAEIVQINTPQDVLTRLNKEEHVVL